MQPLARAACCKWPHRWKGVALRCRRSPRSELEVFCARNELKVQPPAARGICISVGAKRARREHPELKRARYSLQNYRGRQLQTLGCIARAHVEYPLPQSSCSSRAARRKAPSTRAHK
jgi:hypothetical protein